ncbi:MAG TPA: transcription elongation factor GreA [Candidatus Avimonas sp.]|jgi:transcription elongation factor GreA|nr:transcription elongation factor GreA [Clostridiales bacterium]HOB37210.1 transcription elongation factor GreA [Candidatus Avimonas sp.]HQA16600.1 transcription elongation factor GreA [Candidatus Avimonas sp.]HQD38675.1 transcription elongation factor GreA [Candidatus Avimonas sp.]
MNKQTIITDEGLKRLEKELEELKTVKRKEIAERIKNALTYGDLNENSEYDEAKNEQAIIERRINEIENQLKNVKVLDESELNTEIVHIGSRVRVKNLDTGEEETYHIVGSTEANPLMGRISNESPVGREMLTRTKGDVFEVEVPDGIIKYEILEIMK